MIWSATAGRLIVIDRVAARPTHRAAEAAAANAQAALWRRASSGWYVHDAYTGRAIGNGACDARAVPTYCGGGDASVPLSACFALIDRNTSGIRTDGECGQSEGSGNSFGCTDSPCSFKDLPPLPLSLLSALDGLQATLIGKRESAAHLALRFSRDPQHLSVVHASAT
jgi:hypothetical protein